VYSREAKLIKTPGQEACSRLDYNIRVCRACSYSGDANSVPLLQPTLAYLCDQSALTIRKLADRFGEPEHYARNGTKNGTVAKNGAKNGTVAKNATAGSDNVTKPRAVKKNAGKSGAKKSPFMPHLKIRKRELVRRLISYRGPNREFQMDWRQIAHVVTEGKEVTEAWPRAKLERTASILMIQLGTSGRKIVIERATAAELVAGIVSVSSRD